MLLFERLKTATTAELLDQEARCRRAALALRLVLRRQRAVGRELKRRALGRPAKQGPQDAGVTCDAGVRDVA